MDTRKRRRDSTGYTSDEERLHKRRRHHHHRHSHEHRRDDRHRHSRSSSRNGNRGSPHYDGKDRAKHSIVRKDTQQDKALDDAEIKRQRMERWKRKKEQLAQQNKLKLSMGGNKKKRDEGHKAAGRARGLLGGEEEEEGTTGPRRKSVDIDAEGENQNEENQASGGEDRNDDDGSEVDPLDAFMEDIDSEVKKYGIPSRVPSRQPAAISLEEIQQQKQSENNGKTEGGDKQTGNSVDDVGTDDEEFHRQFVEAMRKGGSGIVESAQDGEEKRKERWGGEVLAFSDGEDDDETTATVPTDMVEDEVTRRQRNKKDLKPVDHSKIDYMPFRKAFYIEPPELKELDPKQINARRKELGVKIRGKNSPFPAPINAWHQCGLSDDVLQVIDDSGYQAPFPIQAQTIPCIMQGRDVIGCAKTGSGKTLAFLLPMLRHVMDQPPLAEDDGPIGLLIAPTRELAVQIYAEVKRFVKPLGLNAVCAYGGAAVADQIAQLKRGCEIVVCTPGRMIDLLCANRGKVTNLRRVTYVVLDEADRMFDMGFGPQVKRIMGNVRPDRQTVMFSATFPRTVEGLAREMMRSPVQVMVGGRSIVCDTVDQYVEVIEERSKFDRLLGILGNWFNDIKEREEKSGKTEEGSVLIFVDRQEEADRLFVDLKGSYYYSSTLHGGMDQLDRDFTISEFKKENKAIMIATSVAARGLDVPQIRLVVNYNCPDHYEDYVHRVGRTGRAGRSGTAITFITAEQEQMAPELASALRKSGKEPSSELQALVESYNAKVKSGTARAKTSGYGGRGFKFDEEEQKKRKEDIKRQMKAYGVEELSDEEEGEEEEEGQKPETEAQEAEHNPMMSLAKAKAFAASISIGGNEGMTPNSDTGHYEAEIEINDRPQHARWRVTHKGALSWITEETGSAITTKGSYVPPNKQPPPGERKLYLLIEGPSEEAVTIAKQQVMKVLEEATANAPDRQGKYRVF